MDEIYIIDFMMYSENFKLLMNLAGYENIRIDVDINDKTTLVIGSVYRHPKPNLKEFEVALKSINFDKKQTKSLLF